MKSLYVAMVAACIWARGWRSVKGDPPPVGLEVLGLCDYTGVRSVTARREDIKLRQWDRWHINHPTHWIHIPDALPMAIEPPAGPVIAQTGSNIKS